MPLPSDTITILRGLVDKAVANPKTDIPGVSVVVVDKTGTELFAHAAGLRGLASDEALTLDHVFYIASCTKMLTGVAVMQLVEQGVLRLDDGVQVAQVCPELTGLTVLRPDGTTEPQKKAITLRMLLNHTAGFGYSFFNERLRDWSLPVGIDEFSGRFEDLKLPLLFQPGEGWEYGINLDWAGILLERVTKLSLNDYMQKHILQPLGLHNINMIPTAEMRARLAYMHSRLSDGTLRARDHLLRAPLVVDLQNKATTAGLLNSGGAGAFATPQDYTKVLAVLLNDGTCPRTGARILRKETVDLMFANQIPEFPNAGRQVLPAAKPDLTNRLDGLYPVSDDRPQGWGLTFMISNGGATGRSRSTAHWGGLPNLWWWADREHGVAGVVFTQILPFADPKVIGLWFDVETEVYKGLGQK